MPREKVITTGPGGDDPKKQDAALRPKLLKEVIGQKKVAERLAIAVRGSKKLKEPLGHILFDGPPGLGKTTFATVLPNELGTSIQMTSGPALAKPADLLPFLTNLEEGSVLFIDEIHRMPRIVEEFIYPAMEDFRIDIVLGEGMNARTISMQLKRFTLDRRDHAQRHALGPDARPLQDARASGVLLASRSWPQIVRINAAKLNTPITDDAALELARRSRGTPRIANARLYWTRSYAAAKHDGADHRGDRPRRARHGRGRSRWARQAGPQVPGDADRRLRRRPDRRRGAGRDDEPRGRHALRRDRAVSAARAVHRPHPARPRRDAESLSRSSAASRSLDDKQPGLFE